MAAFRLMVAIVVTSFIGFSSTSFAEESSEVGMSIDEAFELVSRSATLVCNTDQFKKCYDASVEVCEEIFNSGTASCKADLESDLPDKITMSNMDSTVTKIGMCVQNKVLGELKEKSTGASGCPKL